MPGWLGWTERILSGVYLLSARHFCMQGTDVCYLLGGSGIERPEVNIGKFCYHQAKKCGAVQEESELTIFHPELVIRLTNGRKA